MQCVLVAVSVVVLSTIVSAQQTKPDALALKFDSSATHQTMEGWGGVLPIQRGTPFDLWVKEPTAEIYDKNPVKNPWPTDKRAALLADMVFDMGLNRWRLEVGPQVEIDNDNHDPAVANEKAFRFAWQDAIIESDLLLIKKFLEMRGEKLVLYVSYDLRSRLTKPFLLKPAEYAEMAEVFARRLKTRYGLEADYWSVLNEPGNGRPGNPQLYAELTAATGVRLARAGFKTRMSGPESVSVGQVPAYMQAMENTPGALDHFAEITYHLYHGSAAKVRERNDVRDCARKLKVPAAQTEWCEASDMAVARHIQLCLTEADAVAWERYSYGSWYAIDRDKFTWTKNSTAWHMRQFCRYVRPGAVRVTMNSSDEKVRPVAFLTAKKKAVVVIINSDRDPRPVRIADLPTGEYQISYTSGKTFGKELPAMRIEVGKPLALQLPGNCVLTLTAEAPLSMSENYPTRKYPPQGK
ncbi:MAG: hypothetical protein NTV49_05535 [Kiritimatiellaeota bacterium]|nr:hypothetical protein [Kiritimatiellota bacterium]